MPRPQRNRNRSGKLQRAKPGDRERDVPRVRRLCEVCGLEFWPRVCDVERGWGRHCSSNCSSKALRKTKHYSYRCGRCGRRGKGKTHSTKQKRKFCDGCLRPPRKCENCGGRRGRKARRFCGTCLAAMHGVIVGLRALSARRKKRANGHGTVFAPCDTCRKVSAHRAWHHERTKHHFCSRECAGAFGATTYDLHGQPFTLRELAEVSGMDADNIRRRVDSGFTLAEALLLSSTEVRSLASARKRRRKLAS